MQPIIEVRGLTKHFERVIANDDINLKIFPGQTHAIIGENGAGKSTLMNILAGILEPSSGEIFIHGKPVSLKNPNDARKHGVGMVHQEFMLFDELSILDNLIMGYETRRFGIFIDRKKAAQEIRQLCEQYHFSIPLSAKVKTQPVAVLQQVEIIKVLYRGADIIILDEPTSVLTPQGIEGLFKAIRFLAATGKTIIMITHKLDEVMQIADRISVLKNGRLTGTVNPAETNQRALAEMMVGREVFLSMKKPDKQIGRPILELKGLSVQDDEHNLRIRDVTFHVGKGEIVGIAGIAGSGQKELVEALFGLRRPAGGAILYNKEAITGASSAQLRRKKIGYIPQDRTETGSNRSASVMENCIMGYHISHGFRRRLLLDFSQAAAFTAQVVEEYQIAAASQDIPAGQLSGGNLQKLIVGREFLQENDLLIIEDPTRGIDVGAIEFIWNKLLQIAANGTGILLVSHDLTEIFELSDRILILYNGRIAADKITGELTPQSAGIYMTGGNADAEVDPAQPV